MLLSTLEAQVARGVLCSVVLRGIALGPSAPLGGPRDGRGTGRGRVQVHPAGSPGQHVAFVESADTVVLVVDIVGDVLQVLEVGTRRGTAGQPELATATPCPPLPWAPCTLTG